MTDTPDPNTDALSDFVGGVEEQLSDDEETPWLVYGPKWAQDEGAAPPPEDIDDPVWAPSTGWMEKSEAPIHKDGSGKPLAMYAPDSMDEVDTDPPTNDPCPR